MSSAQIENEINSEFRRVHGKTRILVKLAAAALAMPDEIGRKALYQVVGPPQGTRDVRRGAGSGSDQVADPATDLGVPVGMQLSDRGVTISQVRGNALMRSSTAWPTSGIGSVTTRDPGRLVSRIGTASMLSSLSSRYRSLDTALARAHVFRHDRADDVPGRDRCRRQLKTDHRAATEN